MTEETRRSALAKLVIGGWGALVAGLAGLVGAGATPRTSAPVRRWRKAASMFDLSPKAPTTVLLAERRADGWFNTETQTVLFLDQDGAGGYRALSAVCTHLGCRVEWNQAKEQFQCPCHGGLYARDGRVLSGPPPRPLERLPARLNETTGDIEVDL